MRGYDNHRCEGSLDARCSIRRYPDMRPTPTHHSHKDGHWHLFQQDYDTDYMTGYLRHVARIRHCPWCGEEL